MDNIIGILIAVFLVVLGLVTSFRVIRRGQKKEDIPPKDEDDKPSPAPKKEKEEREEFWDKLTMGVRIWLNFVLIQLLFMLCIQVWVDDFLWSTTLGICAHIGVNLIVLYKGIKLKNPPAPELMEHFRNCLVAVFIAAVIAIPVLKANDVDIPPVTFFDWLYREYDVDWFIPDAQLGKQTLTDDDPATTQTHLDSSVSKTEKVDSTTTSPKVVDSEADSTELDLLLKSTVWLNPD